MKKEKKCPPPAPIWLTSWGDLTTLLLTFFVLMFTTAEIDGKDFFLILSSYRGSLGMFSGGHTLSKGRLEEMGMNINSLPSSEKNNSLAKSLNKAIMMFRPEIEAKMVRVSEDERGLIITLTGDAYFDPGSAAIKEEVLGVLDKVGVIINSVPNFVRIEGHTDDTIITGSAGTDSRYETNWELSSARSVNVVRYLTERREVEPRKMSAVGFAQFRAIDNNATPEGRSFNRRVDVVILREKAMEKSTRGDIQKPMPDEEWR